MPDFTTADLQGGRRDEDLINKGEAQVVHVKMDTPEGMQRLECQAYRLADPEDAGDWITADVTFDGKQGFTFIFDYPHILAEDEVKEYGLRVRAKRETSE